MAATSTIMAGLSLAGGISQANAERSLGDYQQSIFNINARFSELQGEDAIRRGDKEATKIKRQAKQLIGKQRATLAAQGIELDEGTALAIQEDTAELGAADAMTVRNNAWREAWGYRAQALDLRSQGRLAKLGSRNRAANSLLSGGLGALDKLRQGGSLGGGSKSGSAGDTFSVSPGFAARAGGYA